MLLYNKRIGKIAIQGRRRCSSWLYFSSYRNNNIIYKEYEDFINMGKKNPNEIISMLNRLSKKKRCDIELLKNITNHIYDFNEDYFCPQLIEVLKNYVKLKYSDETLLGILSNRIDDLLSINSCLRTKDMINIYKQLNFHHPVVKDPLLRQFNNNINNYKNEMVEIVRNLSYLYIDNDLCEHIFNHIIINYDYYHKDIFSIFEGVSRFDYNHNESFIQLILKKKIKELEEQNICCNMKDFLKFLSASQRLGLNNNTYLHNEFEKKINHIKNISPNNISYMLLLMLSTKYRNDALFELIIMNIENYVNNQKDNNQIINENITNIYYIDISEDKYKNNKSKLSVPNTINGDNNKNILNNKKDIDSTTQQIHHNNVCNNYILNYLPFHLLLLILLNYDNKNILLYLLNICINEYTYLYNTSNLIKLLYSNTLLMLPSKMKKYQDREKINLEKNVLHIFSALQNIYQSCNINDYKILYQCYLFHKNLIQNNDTLKYVYNDFLNKECFTTLPSSYSKLKFEEMEVIRYASMSFLKNKNGHISYYLNKNDFYSSNHNNYDNVLLSVKFKVELLRMHFDRNEFDVIYNSEKMKI
ncbi:hypothetical protein PGSY75_1437600 [Plasmodium gaboni]|uniref:Uncharacterized protein n=1 Tax=Plasmodium gaboni TaxID=647221 RepID=A0A151LAJ0_9APIC|nr:hypothetical protein PGSY75_1437600 [Plasmodium gaboni]KYN95972.1 hypothetical protein PGSY75_1437600 [Plasmodium gaboni]